jgi:hypothetical protein
MPDSTSRFAETEVIMVNNVTTYGLWVRPDVVNPDDLNQEDIVTYAVDQATAGRPDLISNQQYGTPFLEWVIVMFNRPLNTLGWPKAGTVIKFPSKQAVRRLA